MSRRHPEGSASAAAMFEPLEARELMSHTTSPTRLTFTSTAASGTLARPIGITVSAKLTSNGLPLRTANVFFIVDGTTSIGQAQTGRSGYASTTIPNLLPGTHTLSAVFGGAARYAASQSRATAVTITTPRYTKTADGLEYATITAGTGATASSGQTAHVNYVGYYTNGTLFQTSLGQTTPAAGESLVDGGATFGITLDVSNVIAGLNEGIKGMKVGETRVLIIPPALGFGVKSSDPTVPDNATLIFFVKLESIS